MAIFAHRHPSSERTKEASLVGFVRMFRSYVQSPTGQIHCRVAQPFDGAGDRPPLVCLHMSPKSGWIYEKLLERLGTDRLVIAPDTPGFGMSDRPPTQPTIGHYADALAAVTAHFGPDTAWDLLGYHTGSQIAVAMALSRPTRVRRLLLISAPLLNNAERDAYAAMGVGRPRIWDEDGAALMDLWRLVLRWRTPGSDLGESVRSLADTLVAGEFGWWGHAAAFGHDMRTALAAVRHPLAIINPGDDLFEVTRRARALCPAADYIEMPDWRHGFTRTYADEAAALIAALLDRAPIAFNAASESLNRASRKRLAVRKSDGNRR